VLRRRASSASKWLAVKVSLFNKISYAAKFAPWSIAQYR
jgi:hypothetical protein